MPDTTRFTVFAGVDWATEAHQVCALSPQGEPLFDQSVPHRADAVGAAIDRMIAAAGGIPAAVAVAIEMPRGILVEALLERGLTVFAINPKQLDRFRDRFFPAGAKDDRRDAFVLADSLRTDPACFHHALADDPAVVRIRDLSRLDDDLRASQNRCANQLREQLRRYYPQLLALFPAASEPVLWDLIEAAPLPEQGRGLRPQRIAGLLARQRIRRLDAEQVRAALRGPSFALAPGTAAAASEHALLLLPQLRLLHRQRADLARRLQAALAAMAGPEDSESHSGQHRDVALILSLPGVGRVVAATMLAEASRPLASRDYHALRAYAGTAPITRQSGKRASVLMRRGCSDRLRNAVYHWARVSVQHDAISREHYHRLRSRGHSHGRALRGVADRLLAVLCALLRTQTLYDPAHRRASPATAGTHARRPLGKGQKSACKMVGSPTPLKVFHLGSAEPLRGPGREAKLMIARLTLLSAVLAFLALLPGRLYAQFSWVTFTTLSGDIPNGQVGLTALNGKLIMTWGDQSTGFLMFSTSTDGVHWTAPQYLTQFPAVNSSPLFDADDGGSEGPPYASGGVNMATSAVCNAAYVSYASPGGHNIYVARTQDGQTWTGGTLLATVPSPSGFSSPGTSSPALYGGSSQPIIEFAYPAPNMPSGFLDLQPDGQQYANTVGYKIDVGQFDCDLSNVQLQPNACFFYDYGNGLCQDQEASAGNPVVVLEFDEGYLQDGTPTGPWSPVWAGSNGVEVKAVSQGNSLQNAEPPTYFSINGGPYGSSGELQCLSTAAICPPSSYDGDAEHYTNNGGSVSLDASGSSPFLFITCAPVNETVNGDSNDHLCEGPQDKLICWGCDKGSDPFLQTYDLVNGYITGSLNWSPVAPATALFNGEIWVAMCGGFNCQGGITVGGVYPAQLTGCSYSVPDIYIPGSATTATGTVDANGSKGGCVWGAYSGSGWPYGWPALTADGIGNGSYAFSVYQNSSNAPMQYSLTAADNQKVTVYEGTIGGTPGRGTVTISGAPEDDTVNECPGNPYGPCWATFWNSGDVSVTVNGETFSVGYGGPNDTSESLAAALAGQINSQPPDSAVSATVYGATIYITSNLNGANTDYSLSATSTYYIGYTASAFYATPSGSALTGGAN